MDVLRPRQQWDVAVEPMGMLEWVVVGRVCVVGLYTPGVLDGCVDGWVLCECIFDVKVDVFWDG